MKYYKLGNLKKKSVYEIETLSGEINGVEFLVTYVTVWCGGEFLVGIPSTRKEAKDYVESMGYETLDEMMSDYGVSTLFDVIMPSENIGYLELNELYHYEMDSVYDVCETSWRSDVEDKGVSDILAKYLDDENIWDLVADCGLETVSHTYHIEGGIYYDEQD